MLQTPQSIALVWRAPFAVGTPTIVDFQDGKTLNEIIQTLDFLPGDFEKNGHIAINGNEIPREYWSSVKPKSSETGTVVTFQIAAQGGKKQGVKQIFAFVAALALTFVTQGIAGGSLSKVFGAGFAKGTIGAKLAAAGASIVGGLAINALTSVPARANVDTGQGASSLNPASVQGNVLRQNTAIPCVIGTRKIFPPFLSEPIIELVQQDELVTAVLGIAGPTKLESVRVGSALASDQTGGDLTITTFDGRPESPAIVLPNRYGKTFNISTEMSVHGTKADDGGVFSENVPVYHAMSTAESADESWLHMYVNGLSSEQFPEEKLRIPFRIRMRLRGQTVWRFLPELHYMDNSQAQRRIQIKFFFGTSYTATPPAPSSVRGWVGARKSVPATVGGTVFNSDSYFSGGAGNDVYESGTELTTKVRNLLLIDDAVYVYLDESWTAGIYDIEVRRGATFRTDVFTMSNYEYSGTVLDFFEVPPNNAMPLSRNGMIDRVSLVRLVNIRNKPGINVKDCALIRVDARNRQVDEVSVIASGYVKDYVPGVGWTNLITTSNPATHFRNVLTGLLNSVPLPEKMLWDESIIEWRQFCIDNDYTCDLIVEGGSIFETLRIVASCGFAAPYQSELWGVTIDRNRSAEPPEQLFTSRNMNSLEIRKAFTRLPSGLRPNYRDENFDYAGRQIVVYADEVTETDRLTEQVDYLGIVSRDKIIRRARTDLRQMRLRSAIYSWNTNVGGLAVRRGSVVAINDSVITSFMSDTARISNIVKNDSGFITAIEIDAYLQVKNNGGMYSLSGMRAVADMYEIGNKTGIAIKNSFGALTKHALANESSVTDLLVLEEPIEIEPEKYEESNLVAFGTIGYEYRRLIIAEITYSKDMVATISAVDEAPEIWSF